MLISCGTDWIKNHLPLTGGALVGTALAVMGICYLICMNKSILQKIKEFIKALPGRIGKILSLLVKKIGSFLVWSVLIAGIVFLLCWALGQYWTAHDVINLYYETYHSAGMAEEYSTIFTTTTTIYATLISIELALIGVAITIYVFLIGVLENRRDFEKSTIKKMRSKKTSLLIIHSGTTSVCIVLNFWADNFKWIDGNTYWLCYCVVALSLCNIIALLIFIYQIINFESALTKIAGDTVRSNLKVLYNGEQSSQIINTAEDLIKFVGDIENIIHAIVQHHEAEYRMEHVDVDNVYFLQAIAKRKNPNPLCEEKRLQAFQNYEKLKETRDCLLVLDAETRHHIFSNNKGVDQAVNSVMALLLGEMMRKEQFADLVFFNVDFSGNKVQLGQTSFENSSLKYVNFTKANLESANFSNSLLEKTNFSGANCRNAVFINAKIFEIIVSADTVCEGATFRNVDFNGIEFLRQAGSECVNFQDTGFNAANLIGCKLKYVNFKNAVFLDALLHGAEIRNCDLNSANFFQAILAKATTTDSDFSKANLECVKAPNSKWKRTTLKGARLAGANFASASFEGESNTNKADMTGLYSNDASFFGAEFKGCMLGDAIFTHADFTNAKFINCDLRYANMEGVFLIHQHDGAGKTLIENTDFSHVNFRNASLRNYRFVKCNFSYAIFVDAALQDLEFDENCQFLNTQFKGTRIESVDFKGQSAIPSLGTDFETIEFATQTDREEMGKLCGCSGKKGGRFRWAKRKK